MFGAPVNDQHLSWGAYFRCLVISPNDRVNLPSHLSLQE